MPRKCQTPFCSLLCISTYQYNGQSTSVILINIILGSQPINSAMYLSIEYYLENKTRITITKITAKPHARIAPSRPTSWIPNDE